MADDDVEPSNKLKRSDNQYMGNLYKITPL